MIMYEVVENDDVAGDVVEEWATQHLQVQLPGDYSLSQNITIDVISFIICFLFSLEILYKTRLTKQKR